MPSSRGGYWVALAVVRIYGLLDTLASLPRLRNFIAKVSCSPSQLFPWQQHAVSGSLFLYCSPMFIVSYLLQREGWGEGEKREREREERGEEKSIKMAVLSFICIYKIIINKDFEK